MDAIDGARKLSNFRREEFDAAVNTLTKAFSEDPCLKYLLDSERYDPEKARHIHAYTMRIGSLYGLITKTSDRLEGVSIWLPPSKVDVSAWMFIRAGGLTMRKTVHPDIIDRIRMYGDYASAIHHRNANMPHWYLLSIAVDKEYQGRGFSRRLLEPVLRHFDENRQTCYLETHNPRNVAFYEKFDFRIVEIGTLPKSSATHWAMIRKPR